MRFLYVAFYCAFFGFPLLHSYAQETEKTFVFSNQAWDEAHCRGVLQERGELFMWALDRRDQSELSRGKTKFDYWLYQTTALKKGKTSIYLSVQQSKESLVALMQEFPFLSILSTADSGLQRWMKHQILENEFTFRRFLGAFLFEKRRLPRLSSELESFLAKPILDRLLLPFGESRSQLERVFNKISLPVEFRHLFYEENLSSEFKRKIADVNAKRVALTLEAEKRKREVEARVEARTKLLSEKAGNFEVEFSEAKTRGFEGLVLPGKQRKYLLLPQFREKLSDDLRLAAEILILDDPKMFRQYLETQLLRKIDSKSIEEFVEEFALRQVKQWALTQYLAPKLLSRKLNKLLLKEFPERVLIEDESLGTSLKKAKSNVRASTDYEVVSGLSEEILPASLPQKDLAAIKAHLKELGNSVQLGAQYQISFNTNDGRFYKGVGISEGDLIRVRSTADASLSHSFSVDEINLETVIIREIAEPSVSARIWEGVPVEQISPAQDGTNKYVLEFGKKTLILWNAFKAKEPIKKFNGKEEKIFRRLLYVLRQLELNPRNPSLNTHRLRGDFWRKNYGGMLFESYLEQNTAKAARIFWYFTETPGIIRIVGIDVHPDNDKAYERLDLDL